MSVRNRSGSGDTPRDAGAGGVPLRDLDALHPMLAEQIRRLAGERVALPDEPGVRALLEAIGTAYATFEAELESRSSALDTMSWELQMLKEETQRELLERRQAEAALRASEASLARAQRIAHLGSWEWDVLADRWTWSTEVFRILLLPADAIDAGANQFCACAHPDDQATVAAAFRQVVESSPDFSIDFRVVRPDGDVRYLHCQGERSDLPGAVAIVGTLQDLTERKRVALALEREKQEQAALIQQLEHTQHKLVQSEKLASIGQLAAGVAHEINNPIGYISSNLATLRGYVDTLLTVLAAYEEREAGLSAAERGALAALRTETDLDFVREDIRATISESAEGADRVRKIVQDLKDFSRTEAQQAWQLADLHAGLDSTLNIVNNEIKYRADVVKEYGSLPQVECLPSQLNQVFMNLLVNAAQAMPDGRRGCITVRTGCEGDAVWVEVADTGAGIAPEHLARIFDPFFTTKPVGKGTGLGLSLSYGIVHKHGGRIEVQSTTGVGTSFRVVLPVRGPGDAAAEDSAPEVTLAGRYAPDGQVPDGPAQEA